MTESKLKALCEEYTRSFPHASSESGGILFNFMRQVLTLDPEPPKKSKGAVMAELICLNFGEFQSTIAANIDKAIADERQAIATAYNVSVEEIAKRLREREDKQEETRT